MALSGSDYHQMEVYRVSIVDLRKACVSFIASGERLPTVSDYFSGLWEKRHLVRFFLPTFGWNLFLSSSSVIHDVMTLCETGSVILAYFYFDFKDLRKQTCHDLLLSLVSQLSTRSSPCCDILHRVYEAHEKGARQPSDDTLKACLKQMLTLPGQRPIYIVLDALDECPDCPGLPPPRSEVLQLVKELVDLRLRRLYIAQPAAPRLISELCSSRWHFVRSPYMTKAAKKRTSLTTFEASSTRPRVLQCEDGERTIRIW